MEAHKLLQDARKRQAVEEALEVLVRLQESGALKLLDDASEILLDSVSYLTDPKLLKIFSNIAYFLHMLELLEPTIFTVMFNHFAEEMSREFTPERMKNPPRMGPMGFVKALSDPDVQKGLGFLFLFLKILGRSFDRSATQFSQMMEQTEKVLRDLRARREKLRAHLTEF